MIGISRRSSGILGIVLPLVDGPAEVSPIPSPRPSGYMSVRHLDAEDWGDWDVDNIYIYIYLYILLV